MQTATAVDNSIVGKYRKVVFVENFFSAIKEVHENHAGYRKTYEKVIMILFIQ